MYLFYRAFVVVSLSRPYDLIYRELSQKNDALRESEKKFHLLFENMMDGFAYCRMLFDQNGQPDDFIYIDVNEAFYQIVGLKNVAGKRSNEVFPGIRKEFPQLFEVYGRVALSGTPESFDIEFVPINKWLHISVYSPEKEHFVAVFEDITRRKKVEEALQLKDFAIISSINAIAISDLSGNLTYINPAFLSLWDIRIRMMCSGYPYYHSGKPGRCTTDC